MVNKALKRHLPQCFLLICLLVLGFSAQGACADLIVDNSGPGTTSTGTWSVSSAPDPYGANSLWARNGATYSWSFTPASSGTYALSMWWTVWPSRSTSVPVDIQHAGGTTRITINQQAGGQVWNPLGQYPFEAGTSYRVTITAQPGPSSTCADAVMFSESADNSPPLAADDTVTTDTDTPVPIDVIENDIDVDGSIQPDSLAVTTDPENGFVQPHTDGSITYTPDAGFTGTDTFSYTVADNDGAVSNAATVTVTVQGEFSAVEIDNGSSATTSTGTWSVSSAPDPYGANSLWARNGATYSWSFTPASSGTYALSMWWTVWPSRSTSVPVDIQHAGGTTRITINQQAGGQVWNPLGQYPFEAGTSYRVTITAQPGPSSTCADAVMFSESADNSPPLAADDTVTTDTDTPVPIDVIENDIDVDGSIQPDSLAVTTDPENGFVQPHTDGSITYTPDAGFTGTDTFSYTVADNDGAVSNAATVTVTVQGEFSAVEIDNGSSATTSTGTWSVSGAPDPYGANSLWARDGATYSWSFTPTTSSTYAVSMWWTVWSSRSTSVPVDIRHAGGTTRLYINQKTNGGQWNSLGKHAFESGQTYSVTITAQPGPSSTCADAVAFDAVPGPPDPPNPPDPPTPPGPEHIYISYMYGTGSATKNQTTSILQDLGAVEEGGTWRYTNTQLDKTFYIHFASSIEGMREALRTEGAHIITTGHSNYGSGPIFSYDIYNIRYIDDDLIFNLSSPWINVSVSGMRTGQPFPNWWPIFKDGTSGIMPYDFGDPQGDPPYNYYNTYQVPGDPAQYKVESVRGGAVERFPDSGRPAWFSADGNPPDPDNPDHHQYYITNPEPWYPSFESYGAWTPVNTGSGFFKENYMTAPAGSGNRAVDWIFQIPTAGEYQVFAWWPAASSRTATAPYTVNHAFGTTTVLLDQRTNGGQWNEIGQFFFDAGETTVSLDDNTSSGTVAADAVRIAHVDNPTALIQADFYATNRSGPAPLDVTFSNQSSGDYTERRWEFGDGTINDSRDFITHTYTSPGTYSVELTVTGPSGSDARTKTAYIIVGNTTPPLLAEFSGDSQEGLIPLEAGFADQSSGDIVSWFWDFGDGQVSMEQNPIHTYAIEGNFTVSLTVTDSGGLSDTEVKENFVLARIYDKSIDNVDYPKKHYRKKTILFRNALDMDKNEFRYARMFYSSCNSGNYYMDTFNRGIMFYTLNTASGRIDLYLKAYLEGKSDEEIWQRLQNFEPIYDYYNFNRYPWGQ